MIPMEKPTTAQLKELYEVEKQLAERLRKSTFEERKTLYTAIYDELLQRLPNHPLLTNKASEEIKQKRVGKELSNLKPFLNEDTVFLEIGPGDCAVACEVAKQVRKVYAIDVSEEITKDLNVPDNFELIISDGSSIPVEPNSLDVAYSSQLIEHLHPDDCARQLQNTFQALKAGGIYYCITPNRLSGPHDVSRHFDSVATGLHLREYTITELDKKFRETGFSKTKVYLRFWKVRMFLPIFPFKITEKLIGLLPDSLRKFVTFNRVASFLLGVKLVGKKGVPPAVAGGCVIK